MNGTISDIPEQDRWNPIEDFNATKNANSLGFHLPQLFEHAAEIHSNDTAVVSGETELTYATLKSLAKRFARFLTSDHGIKLGDVVGVVLDRSVNLVIAVLAIMKAGAVYMPIDPALPTRRVKQMIDDAGPNLLVTSNVTSAVVSSWENIHVDIDAVKSKPSTLDHRNLTTVDLRPDHLAYIVYTSGSTGKPKGAQANHEALCNLLLAMKETPGCGPGDRLLAVASVSFDISIADMFLPLVGGATLVLAQTHEYRDPDTIIKLMRRHGITMTQATPSFWQMLLASGWQEEPRIVKILAAGEPLSRRLAKRLLARADEVWNAYGPSEATIYASMGKVGQQDEEIEIGTPVPNFQLYVLDPEDLSPVPSDSTGELCIGGIGVRCGYHNDSELTKTCFHDNPFHQGRLYRTGDLARFTTPGKLTIVGRADSQVKVRGHRIELEDISAAIISHEHISAALVVSREDQLIAYCLRTGNNSGNSNHVKEHNSTSAEWSIDKLLRRWLADRLPAYMMPALFVTVTAFPMTVNGKIDRTALPDPMASKDIRATRAKPQTELESRILSVWSHVLGHDNIGINDNFFQVGGNSLRVPHVKRDLEKLLGRPILAARLFEHYTIKTLADYLINSIDNSNTLIQSALPLSSDRMEQPHLAFDHNEDIAIISMACRLPGGTTSPEEYWNFLEQGRDAIIDVPKDRWDSDSLFDADPDAPGKSYCRRGGFIVDGVDTVDAPFFGISPREAKTLDPSQNLVLETCWEGFERAGYTMQQLRGSDTGVFIGASNIPAHNPARDLEGLDGYAMTGTSSATLSGRVSYVPGLEGPSLTVDTACSSSLVSTHLACTSLRQRECDMAIAGGLTILSPGIFVEFSRLQATSPDGHCRAFSADAQGTGLSEGSTAVVLKRLSDAQRDGDVVHALLRGSAVNHGGRRAAGLTIPSGSAQEHLIYKALDASQLKPDDIDYLEAHGTATKLGDPIEGIALSEVFGDRSATRKTLWVGSSKSNLGHTQGAAGLAGVIKVALALRHNMLPQTLHVTEPTSLVDWEKARMALVLNNQPWISVDKRPRRAGVSSLGIGGTNAHIIIEEAHPPISTSDDSAEDPVNSQPMLPFLLSAHSGIALRQQVEKVERFVNDNRPRDDRNSSGDLAFSLATTRTHFRRRVVFLAADKVDLLQKLVAFSENPSSDSWPPLGVVHNISSEKKEEPHLAMLFTGQGSQQLGMGKGLCQAYPYFREALEDITSYFTDLEEPLLEVMWADSQSDNAAFLQRTDFAQPAIFALEVALCRLWQSWGVHPRIVLGHSVGEIAAAHIAGVLDLPNACRLVAARGNLMQGSASSRHGSMAALEASSAQVTAAIADMGLNGIVEIAGYNAPKQIVVSGDMYAVELVIAHVTRKLACKVTKLEVSHAFHSHHMDEILPAFRAVAETIQFKPCKLPLISSLTGKLARAHQLEQPGYWVEQARRAVLFSDSMKTLYHQLGVNICLEVGALPILSGMAASCLHLDKYKDSPLPALVPSLASGNREDQGVMLSTLAELHVRHVPIHWPGYFRPFKYRRLQLPTYPFQRQRYNHISSIDMRNIPLNGSIIETNGVSDNTADDVHDISAGTTDHFQFEICWTPVCREDTEFCNDSSSWGLLCPAGDLSWAHIANSVLSRSGIRLIQVKQIEDAANLDGLLCLWDGSSESEVPQRAFGLTTTALKMLQTAATMRFAPPLVWITREAVGVQSNDDEGGTDPLTNSHTHIGGDLKENEKKVAAAPLWGLMRTARYEHQELDLRLIDWSPSIDEHESLALALKIGAEEPECVIRKGQVLRPQIQQVNASNKPSSEKPFSVRQSGAILVTGGLGGIGLQLTKWLISTHHVHDLVLTSRLGMKAPGAEALVDEVARLGATATVVACDVGDFSSVKSVMDIFNENRPLRGVIHAAGLVDSGVLSDLTPQQCAKTFKPKVDGAWNLHHFTQDMDLTIFAMFSSISGVLGLPALGNYAAANTFLDALAHLRRARGLPATSIAYGVWSGKGMATNLSGRTARTHLNRYGLDPLQPEDGLNLFEQAVSSDRALTVAAAIDLKRLENQQKEERGKVPTFFRLLLDQKIDTSSISVGQQDQRDTQLRKKLSEAPSKKHRSIVLAMVRETVGKALGYASSLEVDTDVPLQNIGFDSLTAVLVRNNLAALTQLKTLSTSSIMWNHPNLKSLSQYLLSELQNGPREGNKVANVDSVAKASRSAKLVNGAVSGPDMSAARQGCLSPDINFGASEALQRPKSVLITGATGFVGVFILHELLELGVSVHCLVRAEGIDHGMQRSVAALNSYDLWKSEYTSLLHVVIGDISKPYFSLSEEAFDQLAEYIDAICHAGALVDWMRPLDEYIGPNVISTHEILRLASRGPSKAIHVVSTLATLPKYHGHEVNEGDREYGYSTSKYMAERMVSAARWRGAKASVYRIPFVTASATSGHFRHDRGDFLHNFVAGCVDMGSFPTLNTDLSAVLPVDYLSRTIVSVMMDDLFRIGSDFDFVRHPAPSSEQFFRLIGTVVAAEGGSDGCSRYEIQPFTDWQQQALVYATAHPKSPLARIVAVLDDVTAESAPCLLRGWPPGQHVFGGKIYPAPSVERQVVQRYWTRIREAKMIL